MILYRKRKDIENEKRIIKIAIDVFSKENERRGDEGYKVYDYKKRLERLEGNTSIEISYPKISEPNKIEGIPLGTQFEQTIKMLPEFNFYYDLSEDKTTADYLWEHRNFVNDGNFKPEIWKIQGEIDELITKAKRCEDVGQLDEAAKIYEQLISEKDYHIFSYDRLIKIYSRAKLKDGERRVLKLAISHFSELRERQKEYILHLAQKYGKLDFALDRINHDKKISYYGGAFELYNPYPIIEVWKNRLSKL
jgi:tetratricopeptide (TPR) repeat protein